MDYYQKALQQHEKYNGKLKICSKVPLENKDDLSIYYTPGVAEPCRKIAEKPELAKKYTWKKNLVAVISDGSAVLGLGNIGGLAGLPVMEGKSLLINKFGGVDSVPIVLKTQDPDDIINVIENISPSFGAINLEDIAAPKCFYIEQELKKRLNIPVFHDDQHGTAIVVLAALINALKLVDKKKEEIKVVVSGAGAAGIAVSKLLNSYGVENIIVVDSKGAICSSREGLNQYKQEVVKLNKNDECGDLHKVINGADVFIGVSMPGILSQEDIKLMASKAIIFAIANPTPEIMPDEAKKGGAYVVATGRSDFPNQINNLLAFPGIFRGVLDAGLVEISDKLKLFVSELIADYVGDSLSPDLIIPSPLDQNIHMHIASEIVKNADKF